MSDGKVLEELCGAFVNKEPEKIEKIFGDYSSLTIRNSFLLSISQLRELITGNHFGYLAAFLFNRQKQIIKKIIPYTVVIGVAIPT